VQHTHLPQFTNRLAWSLSRYVQMQNHSYTNRLLQTNAPCVHVTYWDHYDLENQQHILKRLALFMSCIDQHHQNTGVLLPEDGLVPELMDLIHVHCQSSPNIPFKPLHPEKVLGLHNGSNFIDADVLNTYVIATDLAFSRDRKLEQVTNDLRPFWGEQIPRLEDVLRGYAVTTLR